jgi:hypothetical protein
MFGYVYLFNDKRIFKYNSKLILNNGLKLKINLKNKHCLSHYTEAYTAMLL